MYKTYVITRVINNDLEQQHINIIIKMSFVLTAVQLYFIRF